VRLLRTLIGGPSGLAAVSGEVPRTRGLNIEWWKRIFCLSPMAGERGFSGWFPPYKNAGLAGLVGSNYKSVLPKCCLRCANVVPRQKVDYNGAGSNLLNAQKFEDKPMVTPHQEVDYNSANSTHVNAHRSTRSSKRNS